MKRFLFFVWVLLRFSVSVYGEPPIEVIYFQSSDVQRPSQEKLDAARDAMIAVRSFFASEMDKHGFGEKTFDFNRDIKVVKGKLKRSQYTSDQIHREIPFIEWGFQNQIYVVFLGGATRGVEPGVSALSKPLCVLQADLKHCNSMIVVPSENDQLLEVLLAHEIGHSFSLFQHAPTRFIRNGIDIAIGNRIDIMYAPLHIIAGVKEHLKNYALSQKDATFLNDDGRLSVQVPVDTAEETEIDADINDDGKVDLSDVRIVRSSIQNFTSYDTDINNDGVTDEIDLLIVKAKAVEAIVAAAPSFQRRIKRSTWGSIKRNNGT